jgi:putative ABC transport system permease protein
MYTFSECLRAALISIRGHGFRSVLTTLGIIIGVAAVIATISIIQGLSHSIGQQFEGLGANTLTIQSYTPFKEQLNGRIARLDDDDLQILQHRLQGVHAITPILHSQVNRQVRFRAHSAFTSVMGTTRNYQNVAQTYVKYGRFISHSDELTRRRVTAIGEKLRKNLELPENPVGQYIEVNGEWVKIVGLMEEKGELFGFSQDDFAILPYSTMQSINGNFWGNNIQIQLNIDDLEQMDVIKDRITRLLRKSRSLTDDQDDDFRIQSSKQLRASISNVLNSVTAVMGGIVGISLLVGGIGIMNIMLVSVTERTREIGVCKAIGATRNFVLIQFLIEALLLSCTGGLIGLALGYGIGALGALMIPGMPAAHVPLWAIALSVGSSALIGIIFGILPAAKAASLDPIESLRFE